MSIPATAKAWTYTTPGYPGTLTSSTITPPASPSPNHALLRVHACALNPVDIQIMNLPFWSLPRLGYPKTACSDFSAEILAINYPSPAPENALKPGDAVFGVNMAPFGPGAGTLSQIAHVDLAKTTMVRKPAGWSHLQAAGLGCVWLTARTCIELCKPYVETTASKRLVVLGGSSATGMYTVLLAKRLGWKVLSTCSSRNTTFVQDVMGADVVVDYTKTDVRGEVLKFAPDAVVDCVGGTTCLGTSSRYVTIVGDKTGRSTMGGSLIYAIYPRMVWRWFWNRYGWGTEPYDCIVLDQKSEYLEEAKEILGEDKGEGVGVVIDSTFKFEDALAAFERLNTGRARGKVVVEIGD